MSTVQFIDQPDPEHPGWLRWDLSDPSRYNGQVLGKLNMRIEPDGKARLRMYPLLKHTNLLGNLHGGTTLGLIDVALFAAGKLFKLEGMEAAVTLDLSTQFIGAGRADLPLDIVVEQLRETRRLLFLRGVAVQDDDTHLVAAFSATVRKASPPRAAA